MTKKRTTILLITIAILILLGLGGFILFRCLQGSANNPNSSTDNPDSSDGVATETVSDATKFASEYPSVDADNVFVYRNADEIIQIMDKGTGVVYLGFPECPWCQAYVKYLNEVAKETGIKKIYYYNISADRKNNSENYQKIVAKLKDHLQYDEEGRPRIFVPNVSFHVRGELIGNDYETSLDTHGLKDPAEYWIKEEVSNLRQTLRKYMQQIVDAEGACASTCDK